MRASPTSPPAYVARPDGDAGRRGVACGAAHSRHSTATEHTELGGAADRGPLDHPAPCALHLLAFAAAHCTGPRCSPPSAGWVARSRALSPLPLLTRPSTPMQANKMYYLFYSANGFTSPKYAIGVALSNNVTGPYEKVCPPRLVAPLPEPRASGIDIAFVPLPLPSPSSLARPFSILMKSGASRAQGTALSFRPTPANGICGLPLAVSWHSVPPFGRTSPHIHTPLPLCPGRCSTTGGTTARSGRTGGPCCLIPSPLTARSGPRWTRTMACRHIRRSRRPRNASAAARAKTPTPLL